MLRTIADTVVKCDIDEVVWHGYELTKSSVWLLARANEVCQEERTQMRTRMPITLGPW